VRAILWPVNTWWTWTLTANVVAITTGEGVALVSGRSFGVGSDSHCCGGNER
jgi:hypothetical protein